MAFPTTTTVLDDFQRADGPVGAAWVTPWRSTAYTALQITGNKLSVGSIVGHAAGVFDTSFGPNMEVHAQVVTYVSGAVQMFARATGTVTPSNTCNGYWAGRTTNASPFYQAWKVTDGTITQLGTTVPGALELASGDVVGLEVYGQERTHLNFYLQRDGLWYEIMSFVDNSASSPHTDAGAGGVSYSQITTELDDYGAGTIVGDPEEAERASFEWPDPGSGAGGGD